MRSIGIEIECGVYSIDDLIKRLKEKKLNCIYVPIKYKHKLFEGIKLISDSSINTSLESVELNSPIIRKEEKKYNYNYLKKMIKVLEKIKAQTNESCALHIHIESGEKEREKLFKFYKNNEELILRIIKGIQNGKEKMTNEKIEKYERLEDIPKKCNFNLTVAYKRYKTIEIRCMAGSVIYKEIKRLIDFNLDLYEYGIRNEESKFKSVKELLRKVRGYRYLNKEKKRSYLNIERRQINEDKDLKKLQIEIEIKRLVEEKLRLEEKIKKKIKEKKEMEKDEFRTSK